MAMVLLTSLVVGMLLGAILIIVTTTSVMSSWGGVFSHPGATLSLTFNTVWYAYEEIFQGAILNFHAVRMFFDAPGKLTLAALIAPLATTLSYSTPLIVAGLGLAIGFRSSLFDIGGQGQVVIGGVFALLVGSSWHFTPVVQVLLEAGAAILAGALLAGLAGVLKAYTGAHEVIVTMMTNYIMGLVLGWLLIQKFFARPGPVLDGASKPVLASGQLPYLLSHLDSSLTLNVGFLVAIGAVLFTQWFFNRSKLGFELLMVGQNPEAAKTAGLNSKRITIVTMLIAGAYLGLAGMLHLTGVEHYMTPNFGGSYGFDAITVALLGRNKPWGVFFGALFFGAMYTGGVAMQSYTPTNIQFSLAQVIQAVVVFCVATPALVVELFRLREAGKLTAGAKAGGWA
jgi:simple sugar transport system permease protein